jgi:hypothetical protein
MRTRLPMRLGEFVHSHRFELSWWALWMTAGVAWLLVEVMTR